MDKLPRRGKESLEKMKNSTRKGRKRPPNLREQVDDEVMAFWRTPDAHCGRGAKSLETLKKKMDEGMPISLNDQAKHSNLWCTPTAAEAMRLKFDNEHIMNSACKGHVNITSQALCSKLWITPAASEGKRTTFSKEALKKGKENGNLSQEIAHNDKGKGGLNPLWVEQLMGFPVGWTEVCSAEN